MFANGWKRITAALLCGATLLSLAACQEDPEGSIVVHKDMEKLVSMAAASDPESKVDAADIVEEVRRTEAYQTEIEDENLHVKINAAAPVDVPEVEQLSVYRVEQKPFTPELVEKVRAALVGDRQMYRASVIHGKLKRDIEAEIGSQRQQMAYQEQEMRRLMAEGETEWAGEPLTEEFIQELRRSYQLNIDALQEDYETAPDNYEFAGYESDGVFRPLSEWQAMYPEEGNSLGGIPGQTNELLNEISDGENGDFAAFYAQNDPDQSNKLVYRTGADGYPYIRDATVEPTQLLGAKSAEEAVPGMEGLFLGNGYPVGSDFVFEVAPGDAVTLSQQEAQAQAEAFLAELGVTDFSYYEGGLYTEVMLNGQVESGLTLPCRHYYILKYHRKFDNVFLTQASGAKEDYNEGNYRRSVWPAECIEFRMNDSGIMGFDWLAPLEVTETVVENAALKSFADVKGSFEKMAPIASAAEDMSIVLNVSRVCLSYSRISERDSFDTGLIVPVWSFEGIRQMYYNGSMTEFVGTFAGETAGTLLAINAIDGSVIDAAQGY